MKLQSNTLYTNKEIAEWFGLKRFCDKEQKQKKLEQLKLFADYQLVGEKTKKVFIKNVIEPVYSKKGSEGFQIISKSWEGYWHDGGKGIDTSKRVGEAIYKDGLTNLSCSTTISYVGQDKRNKYGINYMYNGSKGYSVYAWGKYVQDQKDGELYLVPLTPEEEQIKNKLIKKYFGNTTQKQIFVQAMVEEGEITKEQAWEVLEELTNMKDKFNAFKQQFAIAIDNPVGKGTKLIAVDDDPGPSAF